MLITKNVKFFMKNLKNKFIKLFSNKNFYALISFQIILILISYLRIFEYERCTELILRSFSLFSFNFDLLYPKMCDEEYYFHGFQWINHIYEGGYVYQDRPLYLAFGFIFYRFFYLIHYFLDFYIDPVSLLLFSTLIFQIFILNLICFLLIKIFNDKFEYTNFILFFLLIIFSFEERYYLFLPSSSTAYFLIFLFSIYALKNKKPFGFIFGLLFTVSAYGIIGFSFNILINFKNKYITFTQIFKNVFYFIIPTLFFETIRMFLGYYLGPQFGVRYIYNAERYQQFVWVLKSIFDLNFKPSNPCQTLNNFIICYLNETIDFLILFRFYIFVSLICLVLLFFKNKNFKHLFKEIVYFSIYSYLFILFQGIYSYRIIYYSLGFLIYVIFAYFINEIHDRFTSLFLISSLSVYTLQRTNFSQFNFDLNAIEFFLLALFFYNFIKNKEKQIN